MLIRKEALEPVGCWEGPGPDAKMRVSGRAHAHQFPLVPRPPVSLPPQWATAAPTSPGDPPDQQAGLTQAPVESLLLLGPSVHVTLWAYQEQSLFPPVLWSSCTQALLALKARCSVGSFSQCQSPRLGNLTRGSGSSLLWENLCMGEKIWEKEYMHMDNWITKLYTYGNLLQYSCLENPHGQRSLVGYNLWGHKESDKTEQLSTYVYMLHT